MNESTSRALLESQALRGRLAASLRSAEMGLAAPKRAAAEDQELLDAEMALVHQAKELLLRPARGLP